MERAWIEKIIFFIRRYWVAELFSIAGTYLFAGIAKTVFDEIIISSYFGTLGAFIGFYSVIYVNDRRRNARLSTTNALWIDRLLFKHLLIEFGLSELFDLVFIRPLCLYLAQLLFHKLLLSMIIGSMVANIFFFVLSGFMFSKKDKVSKLISSIKSAFQHR